MQFKFFQRIIPRLLFLALPLLAIPKISFGQDTYEVAYKAGPILKVVSPQIEVESDLVTIPEEGNEVSYQFGGFLRLTVNNVYFQPEILFSTRQNRIDFLNYEGVIGFNPTAEFEFTTLELPMSIGVNIGNFRLDGGPGFSLLLKGSEYFLQENQNVTADYNNVSLLWRLGAGIDIYQFSLDFKYEFGLSKTAESLERIVGRDALTKQSQLVFSVAYSLIKY